MEFTCRKCGREGLGWQNSFPCRQCRGTDNWYCPDCIFGCAYHMHGYCAAYCADHKEDELVECDDCDDILCAFWHRERDDIPGYVMCTPAHPIDTCCICVHKKHYCTHAKRKRARARMVRRIFEGRSGGAEVCALQMVGLCPAT